MIAFIDAYAEGWPAAFLYTMLNERTAEQNVNISHAAIPSEEEHNAFLRSRPYRLWLIVVNDEDDAVGSLTASYRNELGIMIKAAHRRRGYARAALEKLMDEQHPLPAEPAMRRGRWVANIHPDNEASLALFRGLGGRQIQVTLEL